MSLRCCKCPLPTLQHAWFGLGSKRVYSYPSKYTLSNFSYVAWVWAVLEKNKIDFNIWIGTTREFAWLNWTYRKFVAKVGIKYQQESFIKFVSLCICNIIIIFCKILQFFKVLLDLFTFVGALGSSFYFFGKPNS